MIKKFFNNKLTLILRSQETGKRIEKIKFTKEETAELRKTADLLGVTEKELIDFCRETLAGFKVPKKVEFCELPKTSTGKIQKFELRKKAKELV